LNCPQLQLGDNDKIKKSTMIFTSMWTLISNCVLEILKAGFELPPASAGGYSIFISASRPKWAFLGSSLPNTLTQ